MRDRTRRLLGGQRMPAIGFGTSELNGETAEQALRAAIKAGYRLIDTARIYENETEVGAAVRSSGVPREEFFVTSKLWNDDQGYDSAMAACDASLRRLDLDYMDLYLIHWPATSRRNQSWQALVDLQKQGKVRAIGVSNYTIRHLEELLQRSEVVPAVNQVEFHPFIYSQQRELLGFCKRHNILIEAYSPLARFAKGVPRAIEEIAEKMHKTPAQIILRWCVQHGTVPLPRSRNSTHIQTNFEVFDFDLSKPDMHALNSMSDGERVTWDPANMD